MEKYTLFCTEEQMKKAFVLGAPIKYDHDCFGVPTSPILPTTEQMIGWLEKHDIFININHISAGYGSWLKTISTNENIGGNLGYVSTRKEALLVAIDAALEYLSKNNK